jgi:hypothetical protein
VVDEERVARLLQRVTLDAAYLSARGHLDDFVAQVAYWLRATPG